jgi:hypothetical protein
VNHPNEKESTSFDRITPIDLSFSPVVEDAPYRWLRSLGLNPRQDQGLVQRAIGVALFAWMPIVIWAGSTTDLIFWWNPSKLTSRLHSTYQILFHRSAVPHDSPSRSMDAVRCATWWTV